MVVFEIFMVIAVLAAIGYPLFAPAGVRVETIREGDEYHNLLYAREAAYLALKDLEFDYKTGKLDEDDYEQLKRRYEEEAVAILKSIDGLKKDHSTLSYSRYDRYKTG